MKAAWSYASSLAVLGVASVWLACSTPVPSSSNVGERNQAVTTTVSCTDTLFTESIPSSSWTTHPGSSSITSMMGSTNSVRSVMHDIRDNQSPQVPTIIAVPPGHYSDCLYLEHDDGGQRPSTAPIWIKSSDPSRSIDLTNCTNSIGDSGVQIHLVSYMALENFLVGGTAASYFPHPGFHIDGLQLSPTVYTPSDHVVLRNVHAQYTIGDNITDPDAACCDAIKMNQVENAWVLNSTGDHTGRHGFDNVGIHHVAYCGNTITNTLGVGYGLEAKGASYDVLFEGNYLNEIAFSGIVLGGIGTDCDASWPAAGEVANTYEGKRILARNNVIVNAAQADGTPTAVNEGELVFRGCLDCEAVGNTVWLTSSSPSRDMVLSNGSYVHDATGCTGGDPLPSNGNVVHDNLFGAVAGNMLCTVRRRPGGEGTKSEPDPISMDVTNNVWWDPGTSPPPSCSQPYPDNGFPDMYYDSPSLGTYYTDSPLVSNANPSPTTAASVLTPDASVSWIRLGIADEGITANDYASIASYFSSGSAPVHRDPAHPTFGAFEPAGSTGSDGGTGGDTASGCSGSGFLDGDFEQCQPNAQQNGGITAPWSVISSGGSGVKVNTDYCTSSPCWYRSATHNAWAGCAFGGTQGITQRVTGLLANRNYTFSFYARPSSNMVTHGQLFVKNTDGSAITTKTIGASSGADFNYPADAYGPTPVTATFCTGSATSIDLGAQIVCSTSPAISSGGFEMDDFTLVLADGASCGTSGGSSPTIAQPGYEETITTPTIADGFDVIGGTDGTRPWKRVNCTWGCWIETSSDSIIAGTQSATVSCGDDQPAGDKALRQRVVGVAGATYTFTVDVINGFGAGFVRITDECGVALTPQSGSSSGLSGIDTAAAVTKTLVVNAPADGVMWIEAGMSCASSGGSGEITLDDWTVH